MRRADALALSSAALCGPPQVLAQARSKPGQGSLAQPLREALNPEAHIEAHVVNVRIRGDADHANRFNADLAYATPFQAPLPGQPRPTPRLRVKLPASNL